MNWITIDAHQDIAYNALFHDRDYNRSAYETRQLESQAGLNLENNLCMLGWPEYQRARVALIFSTLFLNPFNPSDPDNPRAPRNPEHARELWRAEVQVYERMAGEHPERFRLVRNQGELNGLMAEWESDEGQATAPSATHPTGLLMLMEGAEHIGSPRDLAEWQEAGVRVVGPVWAGSRFCGGMLFPERSFDAEGWDFLRVMDELGLILDISHMNERSSLQALDSYPGPVLATHANSRAVIGLPDFERHFTDDTINRLVERGGVMGLVPYSRFLRGDWQEGQDPGNTRLQHLIAHVDTICQLVGTARAVALGTDFDGGFGWPDVPFELKTIADLPLIGEELLKRGYTESDVAGIMGGNWRRFLGEWLPR